MEACFSVPALADRVLAAYETLSPRASLDAKKV